MGKGSRIRPCQVSQEQYRKNWLKIFGKKCPECNGTGVYSAHDELGSEIYTVSPCARCNGDGYIKKEK